nr:hypothetical protein [Thermostichus vulcanus]
MGRITLETDKKGNTKPVVRGLVSWDDVNKANSSELEAAQQEIARCLAWARGEEPPTEPAAVRQYIAKYAPPVYDPFAGGGSIPLEAQRLGLEAHASDLNPVAVLINKALIEIPPKFKDQPPVNPEVRSEYGGVRSEVRQGDALPRIDRLAEGDGSSSGSLSSSSEVAQGGNLRDPFSDNASDRISASQHSRGLDKGIGEGKSTVFSDSARLFSRDGDLTNPLREPGMVSDGSDSNAEKPAGRGESNTDHNAAKDKKREMRSEEPGVRSEKKITQFSLLSSHSYSGAQGLAADVRYYGQWMRDRAFERIGHLYPKVEVRSEDREVSKENGEVSKENGEVSKENGEVSKENREVSKENGEVSKENGEVSKENGEVSKENGEASKENGEASKPSALTPSSPSLLTSKSSFLTVIAWLWARTVKCPNPACGCQMPLVRSFQLSTKKGKEAWVEPEVINHEDTKDTKEDLRDLCDFVVPKIRFVVKSGTGKAPEGTIITRKGAVCPACSTPVQFKYIRSEGMQGHLNQQLMAIVAEGKNGRIYISPNEEHERIANSAQPSWKPDGELPKKHRNFQTPAYGMPNLGDLFTPRQLVALTTFSDLVAEARKQAIQDAIAAGLPDDDVPLHEGGTGARAYGEAIATYLGFGIDRSADRNSSLCSWDVSRDSTRNTFGRQAIPMVWDFAEANPFIDSTGNFLGAIDWIAKVLEIAFPNSQSQAHQQDATAPHPHDTTPKLISTDPPYYDAVPYADLSDFFYVWLRRSLGSIYPNIFSTLLVPKAQELVATPYRFGGDKQKAKEFFEAGLGKAFERLHQIVHSDYPLTVYYAFKQTEEDPSENGLGEEADMDDTPVPLSRSGRGARGEGKASTGWETMLEGLISKGFSIDGTWPMRSGLSNRMVARGTNALASSIVLVCRPRPADAPKITRRQFLTELKRQLPPALKTLQQGSIAPVDLAQASIGPGMAVFSQYAAVLENDGSPMRVRTALQLINQILDEYLTEQEGEFDSDTRWALTWFEQHQFEPGQYGDAETLSKAKNTSIQGMVEAGILEAKGGKVRLLKRSELKSDWDPNSDSRMPDWEIAQYLIHELDQKGEMGAAELLAKLGNRGEIARDLAYRLYSLCDRKGWTQEALPYNSLVISWPEITRLASGVRQDAPIQTSLL